MKILKDIGEIEPGTVHLELTGDVDYVSYSELKKLLSKIISSGTKKIIIDLSSAKHIDSSGIGAITSAHIKINSTGGKIYIVSCNEGINRIFDITGLSKVIKIHRDLSSAMSDIKKG